MIRSSYTAVILSLLTTISALPLPAQAKEPKPVGKQNAEQLLQSAQESLAYTTKAARNAGEKLSPENASAKPFLLSLKKVNSALDEAGTGLREKKPEFFKSLDAARSAVAEMQATWDLTGSDDKNVIAGAKKLGGDIIALDENYSPIAARRAKGGDLTAEEKTKFFKIQAEQSTLDKKLAALAEKYKDNKALSAGVNQIRSKAKRIAKAKPSVASYTGAIDLLSAITGMISGYSYYVPASARSEWVTVETLPSSWSYESAYEEYSYEWSSTEESVEIYDSESIEVSETEIAEEDSYLEETDFDLTDDQESQVADASDEIAEDEISDDDLESEQEEVEQAEDEEEMAPDDASDDGGDNTGGQDNGGDDGGGGGGGDAGGGE
ncbi:MAG: hypothetical protein RIR25_426 [Verrucomicrobiota bacterium]